MSLPTTPSRPLRTKRNFKALQLPTGPTLNLTPIASPSTGFRKPPPPSTTSSNTSSSSTVTANSTSQLQTTVGLTQTPLPSSLNPNAPIPSTGDTPVTSQQRSAIRATITKTIAGFSSKSLDLQNEKLVHIREIGQGNGGSVSLVRHRDTQIVMAKKVSLFFLIPSNILTLLVVIDRTYRRKTEHSKTNRSRTSNHARMQFPIHHRMLWFIPLRS